MFNIWKIWTSFRVNPSVQIWKQRDKIVYRKGEQPKSSQRVVFENDGKIYALFWKI